LPVRGQVYRRRRRGRRGRPPTPRVGPPRDLCGGSVVQVREGTGKRLRLVTRMGDDGPRRVGQERAGRGLRPARQTAFMARWSSTRRGLGAPGRRRTRGSAASPHRHRARVGLGVDLDHWVRPPRRLRQQGRPRIPAMAIGVAGHVGSDQASRWDPVPPAPLARQLRQQRVKERWVPALEAESPL
jgi:hypothetical protein